MERQNSMADFRRSKDDMLLAEMYYTLLLETPATDANIQRFIRKYFSSVYQRVIKNGNIDEITQCFERAKYFLELWTPKLQQTIKSAGGNSDVFSYPNIATLQRAINNAQISKTDVKKAYKHADLDDLPLIIETNNYNAYLPLTWEVSRKYFGIQRVSMLDGTLKKGSTWCTAASNKEMFEEYTTEWKQRLIYFVRKKDDKLFAVRCKSPTTVAAAKRYERWVREIDRHLKKIEQIKSRSKYTADMNAGDKLKARAWQASIDKVLTDLGLDLYRLLTLEIKNQNNKEMPNLWKLLETLNSKKPTLEEYISFVNLVIFNKKD